MYRKCVDDAGAGRVGDMDAGAGRMGDTDTGAGRVGDTELVGSDFDAKANLGDCELGCSVACRALDCSVAC